MNFENEISVKMKAIPRNEAFSRVVVAAFVSQLNPSVSELTDIKTAVSEAVTNSIIHGYNGQGGEIQLSCRIDNDVVTVEITDWGRGIDNIDQARTPLFTSKPEEERSGMGFTVMETFMDEVEVFSKPGTVVKMTKKIEASGVQ